MSKNLNSFSIFGQVQDIHGKTTFEFKNKKLETQIITVVTESNQKAFLQLDKEQIKRLKDIGITVGDFIEAEFVLKGSQKGDKFFNNLKIVSFNYVK
jgi:hypothetical protein